MKEQISMYEYLGELNESQIMSIPFDGVYEISKDSHKTATRVSVQEMQGIPADDNKLIELRRQLANLWHQRVEGSYDKLEYLTLIKRNTYQKWMNGSRRPSRLELMKFTVGLSVSIEQANELFMLSGHALDPVHSRLDYIVACALRDGDDIEAFGNDTLKYCDIKMY